MNTANNANTYPHREAWLEALADRLRPCFEAAGQPLPEKIRLSCGFPSSRALKGVKNQTIGQCWHAPASADGHCEIMVSPVIADTLRVADILAHELCHAACGPKCGHKGPFGKLARAIGLEGKLTATHGGEAFKRIVEPLLSDLGPYPHGELDARAGRKPQTTRNIKLTCPNCGYRASTTRKWLDEAGAPLCPVHEVPLEEGA